MFRDHSSKSNVPRPLKFLAFLALAAVFLLVLGQVIMYLWNEILVKATGVKSLNFWEALGLFVLARILFGGFRFGQHRKDWKQKRKAKWKEKWINMNEDEKAAFQQKWKDRCGKK